ncbi:MAG: spermidine synthase [Vulcanimicrobiaceae bacterium]
MPKTELAQWYVERFAPSEYHAHAIEATYYSGRTAFQEVAVLQTPVFGKLLVLDGDTQSSQADERIYHESLVHPALAALERTREILILGGGEGATLREVLRVPELTRCTMVDIDGEVVELARRYLPEWSAGAFEDPRARVVIADALAFLRDDSGSYDAILSDLTEPLEDSPSHPLFCEAAFLAVKRRLAPGGVYALQASTAGFHAMSLHAKIARSLRRHYRFVRSYYAHVPAFDNDWAFLACSDERDLAALPPAQIAGYCERLRGESFFYDAETHRRIFSLPLYLRRELAREGECFR